MTNPVDMTTKSGKKFPAVKRFFVNVLLTLLAPFIALCVLMTLIGVIVHHNHLVKTAILLGKDSPDCHASTVVEKGIKVLGPEVCTDHHTFYLSNGCSRGYGYYDNSQLDMKLDDKLLNSALAPADKQSLANSGSIYGDIFANSDPSPNEYVVSYHPNWFTSGGKAFKITRFDHTVALANCKPRD